eukprot:6150163-Alexandrium_andersonii.AAC.1
MLTKRGTMRPRAVHSSPPFLLLNGCVPADRRLEQRPRRWEDQDKALCSLMPCRLRVPLRVPPSGAQCG